MKRKKLLSTAVAGALVAAQMVMPVAAADGGQVDVDVTTKTAVIRVEVPTTLAIAVNQFEKGDTGSQIYSEAFDITNKSEIPVKISVTSTATLDTTNPIGLVATKGAAESSTLESGEAWLAVAAKTSSTKYIEESGKDIKDLTEANKNVSTFVQGTDSAKSTATASQTFYLNAATPTAPATSLTVTYTKVAPTDADELATAKKISYAQIYELTAATYANDAALQTAVDAADIYEINDTSNAVTLLERGKTGVTITTGCSYYTVAANPTLAKDLTTGKVYVYGEVAAGESAGFRYIGKLSEAKETWTSTDISKIVIKYDITGVTGTRFAEVEDDCEYGLYVAVVGPQVVLGTDGVITMSGLTADKNYAHSAVLEYGGNSFELDTDPNMEWDVDNWSADEGGTLIFKLSDAWLGALDGSEATVTVTLSDDSTITTSQQF